jgi:uncharacterized membrane protein
MAVLYADRHEVRQYRQAVISIFHGALAVAGVFTFVHGRIMHVILFGP